MIVFLDDRFLPADEATVSVFDRGFLYGDALFETIRCHAGRPFLWAEHLQRLHRGAECLSLPVPVAAATLHATALELLRRNALTDAVLRLTLSRGVGPRGYSPRGATRPTLVLAAFPAPAPDTHPPRPWHLRTSGVRLPAGDPLAAFKTANKLLHVLARAEVEASTATAADADAADEALLLNTQGHVAETSAANVFWWNGETVSTPALTTGALAGVTRAWTMRALRALGWPCREVLAGPEALGTASGVFLTFSGQGLVEVGRLDGQALSIDARFARIRDAYRIALRRAGSASD